MNAITLNEDLPQSLRQEQRGVVQGTRCGISNAAKDYLNRFEENINDLALFFSLKMVKLDLPKTHATIDKVTQS